MRERLDLRAVRLRMNAMAPEEILRVAMSGAAPGSALARALGVATPPAAPLPAVQATPPVPRDPWERITLLPGLELHLSAGAGPAARALADRLCAQCDALLSAIVKNEPP